MKRPTMEMPAAPGCPGAAAEVSAVTALQAEVAALRDWLTAQGLDLSRENPHEDDGTHDRLCWRYGYYAGLKHALHAVLFGRRETMH